MILPRDMDTYSSLHSERLNFCSGTFQSSLSFLESTFQLPDPVLGASHLSLEVTNLPS